MVTNRSNVSRALTGFHGGLRRGTTAAALGAVLVLTAGVPASHASGGMSLPGAATRVTASAQPAGLGDWLGGLFGQPDPDPAEPSDPPVTPGPSPAPVADKPAPVPSSTAVPDRGQTNPATTPAPAPAAAQTSAPSSGPAPTTAAPPAESPVTQAAEGTTPTQATAPDTQPANSTNSSAAASDVRAGAAASSPGSTARPDQPAIKPVSNVVSSRVSAMIWWGLGLVALAAAAGLVFLRMRKA